MSVSEAIRVRALDHVVVRASNLEASLRFYCGALGLREERRLDELGLVQLRAGASLVDIVDLDRPLGRKGGAAPGTSGRNVDHFALELEDFDEAAIRAQLSAQGVVCGEVARRYGARGFGPSMYIEDPDGNVVELKGPPEGDPPRDAAD